MLQTVVSIPHEVLGWPVFGFGWALMLWAVFGVCLLGWLVKRQGWNSDTRSYLPVLAVIALAIVFVMPRLEQQQFGVNLGLPIRGYGVMLLIAVLLGVSLSAYRAQREGLDPEIIYSLAFWMFAAGIVGARAFFVIQYWDNFRRDTLLATLGEILKVTEGGLVVYGSLIGGLLAAVLFLRSRRASMFAVGDIVAPGMLVGLAVGRVGCLLNGCCFGGICEAPLPHLAFPIGSPPYIHQLETGELLGVRLGPRDEKGMTIVAAVTPDGLAAAAGVRVGERVAYGYDVGELLRAKLLDHASTRPIASLESSQGVKNWTFAQLPRRSRHVHPTQIYSAINAALLAFLLWQIYPYRTRDGQVFALLLTLYPLSRFVLEVIRNDEPSRFGTELTISQLVSLLMLPVAICLWVTISRHPTLQQRPTTDRSGGD